MAYITISPAAGRLRVLWNGHVVADTDKALDLKEGSYGSVHYVPRADVDMTLLRASSRQSHCPHKGDASYFSLVAADGEAPDSVWTYEHPFEIAEAIAGHLAFYPNKVTFETM
jgi:uncharacterized protein (DUF427 family)